ncbi:non-ribosomal peptide synthetase [Lentzea fradiae]|uniref:non-ribosomal peptide synthetase n=1 Tax=Lentzea fradiae TaxID=200378 RepID=UPI001FE087D0|nr:non-ribosomal peptide synthetase [Lentzea fradiae]
MSHELIARQAASSPDAVALVEGTREVSYRELDRRSNQLAHSLRANGVRPADVVAVRLPRSADLIVALLAVWKAGAAYLPIDPTHPAARIETLLADAGPRLVIDADVVADALGEQDFSAPDVPVSGDHPAYVLHTSGSTGTPKGVVISHAGIGNHLGWRVRSLGLQAGDRVLQKTAITFDAACWEIWAPLISGATVVLAPAGAERDAAAITRAVVEHGITVLQVVPSVLRALVEEPGWADCTTLRVLSSGGEQLHADLVQRFLRAAGNCDVTVWNTYGPTECSVEATAHEADSLQRSGPVPIGAPIDGVRAVVAPDGELLLGGPGVAHGYLGNPALTAERFVPDPGGPPGSRLYRSGDLVRVRADGTFEFLGRTDHQVKVNGVRIEPGEVETALQAHPAVLQAVVAPFDAATGATRLAAYVRMGEQADLAAYLGTRLPETHVPAAFVELDEFPMTSSGKVDRRALPVPGAGPAAAPGTEAEELVAGVWRELLGVARVGAHDDFFRLGGSSLQLTRLGNRLRAATGVEIPLAALLSATTVTAQARLIDPRPASSVPVVPVPRTGPLPLSFGQQRLWLLDRIHPRSREWVSGLFLRTDAAETDVRRALDALVARHESLRTRFGADEPLQLIDPPRPMELRVVTGTTPDEIAEILDEDARRGFDLANGPVVRALLFPEQQRLVVLMHHIVCDGWSSAVLEREFHEVLAGRELPAPTVHYADFAVWQRDRLTDDVLEGELTHWRQVLEGSTPLALRTDRPRPAAREAQGAVVSFTIPAPVAAALAELGRRSDATPFMTMLTAYATLLARYTAQWDVVIGTPVAGRDRPEVEDVVGFFLNSLVLRCRLAGELTFEQALETVRNTCKEAFAHQELPFERLVAELAPERDLSRTPLYQVAFDFHGDELTGAPEDDAELSTLVAASRVAKTDLTLYLRNQSDGSMTGMLEYATALFDHSTVDRLARHFQHLLHSLAESPRTRLDTVGLLTADERDAVREWTENPVEPVVTSVLDEFERQAAATPDAVALVTGGRSVTYADLDAHATRLAHRLRDRGVGPESVVGVLLDRGADLLAAFLAVWKAGAAYVPLDPDFPADRVGYVLADARADVLVTADAYRDRFGGQVVLAGDEGGDASPLPRRTDLDGLAYVIYTSGSTGRPKGVQVPHRGLANHVRWAAGELAKTGGAPVFSSVAFDLVVPNVWAPLVAGHSTHLLPQDLDLSELGARLLEAAPFGFIKLTPGHLDVLSHQLTHDERARLADVIVVAGEALPPRLAEQWVHCNLVNEYGPTETSVGTCVYPVREPVGDSVPIGKPLPGMTMHVLDDLLRPVPVGVVGEVYVGGAGVARGYAHRPELTAERFLPDPYGPPGARFYRTGDLARLLPTGDVDFLGRRDQQVKIRGYRVEPGEIAAVISEHPEVRDAVVVAREGALAAYYVPVAGEVALTDWCAGKLPAYMVPGTFTALDAFPLNANGKLDHAALPAAEAAGEGLVAPRGVVEERVAEIFTDLLGVPVGAHSHFFSSGGNSILAIRLIATIQSEFEVTVPMRAVFEGGTVADLAEVVEEQVRAELDQMSDEELAAQSLLLDESGMG